MCQAVIVTKDVRGRKTFKKDGKHNILGEK